MWEIEKAIRVNWEYSASDFTWWDRFFDWNDVEFKSASRRSWWEAIDCREQSKITRK